MTWEQVEASELMARRNGSVDPAKFPDEKFELHSIPAFDAGRPDVVYGREIGSSKQIVEPGDVMISKIVPHIRRSSVVGESSGLRQIASGEWIVFRSGRVYPHYLRHLLVSENFNASFMKTVSGVGGSLLRARPAEVAKIKIPLPPMPEQRRIAAILDKADALRAKRREAIAKLDQLLQSVFLDMFGDPVSNPKHWKSSSLKDSKAVVQTGPFGSLLHKEDYISGGIPLINPMHIVDGAIRPAVGQTVSAEKATELENYRLRADDVVMGRRGEMGRCAVVSESEAGMLCGTGSLLIRPDASTLTSVFLAALLSNRSMKLHLESLSQGVTMANLNSSMIEALRIIHPPTALQQQFSRTTAAVEQQMCVLQRAADHLDSPFTSLQHRAFTGTL